MTEAPAAPAALPEWVGAPVAAIVRGQQPPPTRPLGPGDPLPDFKVEYGVLGAASNEERIEASGGVVFAWGDLRLQSEYLVFDQRERRVEAAGNVVLTRGDERVETDALTIQLDEGTFVAERAVAVSPPVYVRGDRLERYAGGIVATNALVTLCPEGRGEFFIRARQVDLVEGRYAVVRDASLHLFGARLFTVRRYKFPLPGSDRGEGVSLPLTVRLSRISGAVVGATNTFSLGPGTELLARVEVPTRRGLQYGLTVRRDFLGEQDVPPDPRRSGGLLGGGSAPADRSAPGAGESPLRQLLRARTRRQPDAVLDYQTILSISDPLARPTQGVTPELRGEATVSANEEVGSKRQGNLLFSRRPEVRLHGRLPLGRPVAGTGSEDLRSDLRAVRAVVTGDFRAGDYRERRLQQDETTVDSARAQATVGIGTLPLLVGERLLVRPQLSYTHLSYEGGQRYFFFESSLAVGYVFGPRAIVGAEVLRRDIGGSTPFTFDEIDTQDEARFRAQGQAGRFTLGLLGRYDLDQKRLFDYEVALAVRGRCVEPRVSYQRLGNRINFGVSLVGF